MLSWSVTPEDEIDTQGIVKGAESGDMGIEGGVEIANFVEAVVKGTEEEITANRGILIGVLGPVKFVEVIATAAMFEQMVRIADGTGIALDDMTLGATEDLRDSLGLNEFSTAQHTFRKE
ncbi:MAG: hypothetical protein AAF950_02015 [Pseudomonadota bacterium]